MLPDNLMSRADFNKLSVEEQTKYLKELVEDFGEDIVNVYTGE